MKTDDKPKIGNQIRRIRRSKDMTQAELSEKVGITAPAISNIEQCKSDVRSELILKIAEALQVEVSELFEQPENDAATA